jgi:ribosomal protein S18 acetylase RimI-like enzyme
MAARPRRLIPAQRAALCAELLVPHAPRGLTAFVADDDHIPALVALSREGFGDAALDRRDFAFYVHEAHALILGLQKRQSIIAYTVIELNAGQQRVYVVETFTVAALRGRGHGSWLRGRVEAIARALGYRSITSHVSVHNTAALELNQKAGLTVARRIRSYYEDGRDAFYLRKVLSPAEPAISAARTRSAAPRRAG